MIFNTIKANAEIKRINTELETVTKDRDLQVAKLKEFETTNKDYIESAQTANQMQETHKTEMDKLKSDYELKLAGKDKELVTEKESKNKEIETVKQESEKTISTVKASVAEETIRIVASQGTNLAVESVIPVELQKPVRESKVKFQSISWLKKI